MFNFIRWIVCLVALMVVVAEAPAEPIWRVRHVEYQLQTVSRSRVVARGCQCGCGRKHCRCGKESQSPAEQKLPAATNSPKASEVPAAENTRVSFATANPSVATVTGTQEQIWAFWNAYKDAVFPGWREHRDAETIKAEMRSVAVAAGIGKLLISTEDPENLKAVRTAIDLLRAEVY